MSQKKRGSNPIRITLTEDQISDIIQSAAKTRRGLKVESLEDRIAPSVFGGLMFDPGVSGGDLTSDGAPAPDFDPNNAPPGLPGEPPLPGGPLDPTMPPLVDSANPPVDPNAAPELPGNPPLVSEAPFVPPVEADGGFVPPVETPFVPPVETPFVPPVVGDPDVPVDQPVDQGGMTEPNLPPHQGAPVSNQMPSSQEIEEHRRNILRQLRGN